MVRRGSFVIGLGLALFWWIGLSLNANATLLWFDAVGAVLAFAIGGLVDDTVESNPANALGPALLGIGLAVVWIAGLASGAPAWVSWPNFGFAVASLAVAVMALGARTRHVHLARRARA
jgi:hypothetical protein